MDKNIGNMDLYIKQLQKIGFSEDEACSLGQLVATSAEKFAEMFGSTPEEYLQGRFAGYHSINRVKFKDNEFCQHNDLDRDEEIRENISRKPDIATVDVVNLHTDFTPKGGIGSLAKWVKGML